MRTAGSLQSETERQALEARVREDLAKKDRELAAALDRCLKEAGKDAEELAVRHAREAFEKFTKKFNDEMAAASARVAANKAAAKEALTLGPRIREVAEKTAKDEFLALDDCVKSADALLSTENDAAALGKCLQSAAARKAAADSSAMSTLLEEARKKVAAEEETARKALLKDLLEKEKIEAAEVEQCVKEATARVVAEETSKIEELYDKKAQETLALVEAEMDLCVHSILNLGVAEEKSNIEACMKQAAKKKAEADSAALEALIAEAGKNIQEEEKAAIHICTQRAIKRLQGEDGAGPSGKGGSHGTADVGSRSKASSNFDDNDRVGDKSAPGKVGTEGNTGVQSGINEQDENDRVDDKSAPGKFGTEGKNGVQSGLNEQDEDDRIGDKSAPGKVGTEGNTGVQSGINEQDENDRVDDKSAPGKFGTEGKTVIQSGINEQGEDDRIDVKSVRGKGEAAGETSAPSEITGQDKDNDRIEVKSVLGEDETKGDTGVPYGINQQDKDNTLPIKDEPRIKTELATEEEIESDITEKDETGSHKPVKDTVIISEELPSGQHVSTGSTPREDEGGSKSAVSLGKDVSSSTMESSFEEDYTESKSKTVSKKDDASRLTVSKSDGKATEDGQATMDGREETYRDQSQASKHVGDDRTSLNTKSKYDECRKILSQEAAKRGDPTIPPTRKQPAWPRERQTGHWVNGVCVPDIRTPTLTRRDDISGATSRSQGANQGEGRSIPSTMTQNQSSVPRTGLLNVCVPDPTKQSPVQKKTPIAPVTKTNDHKSTREGRLTATDAEPQKSISGSEERIEEAEREEFAQKKSPWKNWVENYESARAVSTIGSTKKDDVSTEYSTTQDSTDYTLSASKKSKVSDENVSVFPTAVSVEEEEELVRAVSNSVQVMEEMCDEEVQTAKLEVNAGEVQTVEAKPNVKSEEVQTIDMRPEITGSVQNQGKHTTEAEEACYNGSTREVQSLESQSIPKDQPPGETSTQTDGDQKVNDTTNRDNFSCAESVPEATITEDSEYLQSFHSQLQRIDQECENGDALLHIEIAMCDAMALASKFRELKKTARSLAEKERLDKKATELETIVAETAASYESGKRARFGILGKMDKASDRPASNAANPRSGKDDLAEEAAGVERLVAETVTICRTKAEAARLREAGALAQSQEEKTCLGRAAADREALVVKLERCAAQKRKLEAQRVTNEVAAYGKSAKVSDDEKTRSEMEAYERGTLVSDNDSMHKSGIDEAGLRGPSKSVQSPGDRCLEQTAAERRDFTERLTSMARPGTRRSTAKKDSHGPKRNKPSSVDSCTDSLRLPRRPDQRSFSCANEALFGQSGVQEGARKCPIELPIQQLSHLGSSLSAVCLMTLIPVGFKEDNLSERSQSHPLGIQRSDSGEVLIEAHRLKGLKQLNQVSRLLPSVTKRQCRAFAEWAKQECVEPRVTDIHGKLPNLSNLPQGESKTITHLISPTSDKPLPSRISDCNNETTEYPSCKVDSGEPLKHEHNMPAQRESLVNSTEPTRKAFSENNCKRVDSKPTFIDWSLSEEETSSEPQDLPSDSIPEGRVLSSSNPGDEEICLPAPVFQNKTQSSLVLQQRDLTQREISLPTVGGISSTSLLLLSTPPESRSGEEYTSAGANLQVTAEHRSTADEEKSSGIVDHAIAKLQRSNSYNSRSEDKMKPDTADIVYACSGECSNLTYQALLSTVDGARSLNFGVSYDGALERGINEEKSAESFSASSPEIEEQSQELVGADVMKGQVFLAFDTDVERNESGIQDLVALEEASTVTKEKSEIFFDSISGATSPSRQSAYASLGSSSFVNIPADRPALREESEGRGSHEKRISLFSDTSHSDFLARNKDPPDQIPEKNKSVRQSSSAMSFPSDGYSTREARSSKSEHDLVVEDVILAVEATARYAARAAAARDRAFEAAGVAVRAVASEDVTAARRAVQSSRDAAEVAVEHAACAARESIKAASLATTSRCSRRASSLATASALAAQQDSLAAERFFSHASDALQCLELPVSGSSDDRLAAETFKQVVTSSVLTNDAAAKARVHLAEAASAAQAVERIIADPSQHNEDIVHLEQAATTAADEAAHAAAEANAEAEAVARACMRARRIASASCRSAFAASAARHSSTSADSARIKATAAAEAASAAKNYAQQASDAAAVIAVSSVSETARMAAYSASLVAAAKTAAARSASQCSQAKAVASEAAAQIAACMPADCLCISLTESTKLEAFALAKTAEAEAAASRATEKAGNAASHAATAYAISLNVQELVARDESAAVAVRYSASAAQEATRLAESAAEDAEAANAEASVCRNAAASFHLPPRLSAGSVVQIKSASLCSFETERRSSLSETSRARSSLSQTPDPNPPL